MPKKKKVVNEDDDDEPISEAVKAKIDYMTMELEKADKTLQTGKFDKAAIILGGIDTDCELCQEEIDLSVDGVRHAKKICKTAGKKQCKTSVETASKNIRLFIDELKSIK